MTHTTLMQDQPEDYGNRGALNRYNHSLQEFVNEHNQDAKQNHNAAFDNLDGRIMTLKDLQRCALEHGGYETPELNDILYLHFVGYRRIENLDRYTGLKALHLDSNGLFSIENLSHLKQLRCIFLQKNLISSIEGLAGLDNLVQLDLSYNRIETVGDELSRLPSLATLNLAKNALSSGDSIAGLSECCSLTSLDLTGNNLAGDGVLSALVRITKLRSLAIKDNPVVKEASQFRKKCITSLNNLCYLDTPIFEIEQVGLRAWKEGGIEAEREARNKWHEHKKEKERLELEVSILNVLNAPYARVIYSRLFSSGIQIVDGEGKGPTRQKADPA